MKFKQILAGLTFFSITSIGSYFIGTHVGQHVLEKDMESLKDQHKQELNNEKNRKKNLIISIARELGLHDKQNATPSQIKAAIKFYKAAEVESNTELD